MREDNSSRDIFNFLRLPLDMVYVACPYKVDPNGDEIQDRMLPMLDPHELVDYLWRTGKIAISPGDLAKLISTIVKLFVGIFSNDKDSLESQLPRSWPL